MWFDESVIYQLYPFKTQINLKVQEGTELLINKKMNLTEKIVMPAYFVQIVWC